MNIIREFLAFKRMYSSYQKIDLEESEKIMLQAFDKELIRHICNKSGENLAKLLLQEDLTIEYARGYKHALFHILSYFKKVNKE